MKFSHRICVLVSLGLAACGVICLKVFAIYRMNVAIQQPSDLHIPENDLSLLLDDFSNNNLWSATSRSEVYGESTTPSRTNFTHSNIRVDAMRSSSNLNTWDLLKQADEEFANRFKFKKDKNGPELKQSSKPLRVIVIPNSHNDPGWLKTLQGYYSDQTKHILDAMVEKLTKYPKMTFIWAESVFLELWWSELESEMKETVRRLIEQRQLEIVGGGWVVPDEANPTYYALIDQLIEGHQWLEHTLMVKPNNSWSLDPFGYSSTLAYIYKKAGFRNMAIQRVQWDIKRILQNQQNMEFLWRQHWDIAGEMDMFTLLMSGVVYDISYTCGPDKPVCSQFDFRKIPGEDRKTDVEFIHRGNVERQAKKLLGQYFKKSQYYKHNVILVPIGGDFRFDQPLEWDQQYKNYQLLFNYMNSRPDWNINVGFGILQDYFDAVHAEMDLMDFPTMTGDFFAYADANDIFWTGYYTTRAFQKKLGRELESHLRAADMLLSLAMAVSMQRDQEYPKDVHFNLLQYAHRSLGLFQHHDAITGTARAHVAKDYEQRLLQSLTNTDSVITESLKYLTGVNKHDTVYLDDSRGIRTAAHDGKILRVDEGDCHVTVFNPIAHQHQQIVRVLVSSHQVAVLDDEGRAVPSQLHPFWKNGTDIAQNIFELLFYVSIGPLATRVYTVRSVSDPEANKNFAATVHITNKEDSLILNPRFRVVPADGAMIVMENAVYQLRVSPKSGFLMSIANRHLTATKINLQFLLYKSHSSGAYLFMPAGPAVNTEFHPHPTVRILRGPLLSEVHSIQPLVHHIIRLYNTSSPLDWAVELRNAVDLREMDDKEMIMRFVTGVAESAEHFYVDSNSLHMRKRGRFVNYPLQGNYYPMNSAAYLDDTVQRFSVYSAQPHGCASLVAGHLEVMLDRRLRRDDGKGLGEGITDNRITPSTFYLTLERKVANNNINEKYGSSPSLLGHTLKNYLNYPLHTIYWENSTRKHHPHFPFVIDALPCDVRIVAMRPLPKASAGDADSFIIILHRVSHDAVFADDMLQCGAVGKAFTLGRLLPDHVETELHSVKEMTLTLLHEKRPWHLHARISLQPMDMVVYKLTF